MTSRSSMLTEAVHYSPAMRKAHLLGSLFPFGTGPLLVNAASNTETRRETETKRGRKEERGKRERWRDEEGERDTKRERASQTKREKHEETTGRRKERSGRRGPKKGRGEEEGRFSTLSSRDSSSNFGRAHSLLFLVMPSRWSNQRCCGLRLW